MEYRWIILDERTLRLNKKKVIRAHYRSQRLYQTFQIKAIPTCWNRLINMLDNVERL